MTDLSQKVALVTGSSRGIGRAIAERFAALGARIVVNHATDAEQAEAVVQGIRDSGADAIAVQADVSKVPDLDRLFEAALCQFGQLDIVVANAGIEIIDQPIADFTEADYDRLLAVNTKGALFTLQRAGRHICDNGRIIYIGSSTTAFALPGCGLYGASKMAARYLVEVLAKEIGHRGVTVNSIIPTAIDGAGVFTDGANSHVHEWVKSFRPIRRMGMPEDVANAAEYLARPLSGFVSGQHLMLSGGAHT